MIRVVIEMKIKLYFENEKAIAKSGIGKALQHQKRALTLNNIPYTTDHRCQDYDVLHINTLWFQSYLEVKKAQRLGKAIVFHAHSTVEDFKNSFAFSNLLVPFYRRWLVKMYSYGDCIVTPTEYSKSLLESYGLKQSIFAISNGIDVDRYQYDEKKVQAFRDFFSLSADDKVIISVGWLFERKGFDTFCEVASQLPDYQFIWFGDKNLSMPTANIRHWIEHKPDNVHLPGYITGDVITGAYLACDVFFFPSREETEGIVVLEALAAKAPVLVRDIGVYDGWLQDGQNCYKGKDIDTFVSIIKRLVSHELPDLSSQGYQTALSKGFKAIGQQLLSVYQLAYTKKEQQS